MLPHRRGALIVVLAALVTGVACARAREDVTAAGRPARPPRRSPTLISAEELSGSTARDASEAVRMLRPEWLHARGATSFSGPGVPELLIYLDGQRMGLRQVLAQYALAGIKEIRFYSAADATQRWGTGHSGGVIEIISIDK